MNRKLEFGVFEPLVESCTYRKVGAIDNTSNRNANVIQFLVDFPVSHDGVGSLSSPKSVVVRTHLGGVAREPSELNVVVSEGTSVVKELVGLSARAEESEESCQKEEGNVAL